MEWAYHLQEVQDRLFWDSQAGGYFESREGDPHVIIRLKEGILTKKLTYHGFCIYLCGELPSLILLSRYERRLVCARLWFVHSFSDQDGAEPTANSVAARNLLRLNALLDEKKYMEKAEKVFSVFGIRLKHIPMALPQMLVALIAHTKGIKQVSDLRSSESNR